MQNVRMIDHRLITLRAFASCGTIAATAELTGFSPSAVSAQLREFQRALDMTLLVKDGRGLRLTATGRDLVNRSDALVAEWERTRSAVLSIGGQVQTKLGIGGFSTASANLLAPLAARLRITQPATQVSVIEADPLRCLDLLTAERLDLAVIVAAQAGPELVQENSPFEQIELLTDPLDVMMSSAHPLAKRDSVALEELADEDWITDTVGAPYHALFIAAFASVGVAPRVLHEANEWETAMALAGAGLGMGLLPRLVSIDRVANVSRVRLAGTVRPVRKIVAVMRRGSAESPLIAESLHALRDISEGILRERLKSEVA